MRNPTTWEEAASAAYESLRHTNIIATHAVLATYTDAVIDDVFCEQTVRNEAETLALAFDTSTDVPELDIVAAICTAGAAAMNMVQLDREQVVNVLAEKQRAYGHDNILAFGQRGIAVRVCDKAARLSNLLATDHDPEWETLADTWLDLLGYAVVSFMLHRHWFELELADR